MVNFMSLLILLIILFCLFVATLIVVGLNYGGVSWFMLDYAFKNVFGIACMAIVLVGMHSGDHITTLYAGLGGGVIGAISAIRDLITQAWDR